ncbi:MAG TPA: hypothetical protein PK109_00245 [Candidatus Paceibacterota bacterium]|nr:hypothetical protein [Candidatus Paceibacterota bacterium]
MGEEAPSGSNAEKLARTKYISATAFTLLPEMRTLFRGGKLTSESGWRNVAEHCFASAVAADIFTDALNLTAEEGRALTSTSAVSDWNKRLEKRPGDFSNEDKAIAQELLSQIAPDKKLLAATHPEFFVRAYEDPQNIPFLENLMLYIDNTTDESNWVSFRERLPKVMNRWKDLDETYSPRLGGKKFVEFAIEHDASFQEELYVRLKAALEAKGREAPTSPDDIPAWLNRELDRRVKEATRSST